MNRHAIYHHRHRFDGLAHVPSSPETEEGLPEPSPVDVSPHQDRTDVYRHLSSGRPPVDTARWAILERTRGVVTVTPISGAQIDVQP